MIEIGNYTIEKIDEDYYLITQEFSHSRSTITAKIAGGDLETVLANAFLQIELKHNIVY